MTVPVPLAEIIVGDHPCIVALRDLVLRVARSHASTVLLYGETGTGKGLVARALHEHSSRADKGFTEINCAAIPGNLLESELFGHERGAFTGAVARKAGLLETAHGGSVFLDEVRELDPMMQAKILTLLDSRRFRRIGAVREVCTDVRFIAATNKILLGEVGAGKFRDDLYYRLQVVSINLPPLRERGDDIFVLAERFLARFNRLHASHFERLDAPVEAAFRRYAWPGNVRELGNLLERICILESGTSVGLEHLPARIVRGPAPGVSVAEGNYAARTATFQRGMIESALAATGGNLGAAASTLGLSRHALRHQMTKLDMAQGVGRS
ncbi:sigma-54 interaction domain-containing protein [Verminephrobacter eiseniae]|uniref:sigma-54 interaction domain-containing protein n=1 Tax=Verminephrobacter eiseniae TaxID=364317 RepID=UPI00223716BA|nr:sigma-54 dependent transcriptional regulator [Verminephrobacter eiseniae]MCW5237119.1 sigma-54-dependent Fis family transcriptional regulator [Verminephrobacter eiseniae]